jgi:hypothetical protein
VSRPPAELERAAALVRGTALDGVRLAGVLGEGGRSTVLAAEWHGRAAALKVYKPSAIERHRRKHPLPLAEFEYAQNLAYHRAPGLAPYVAEPLGRLVREAGQAFLQERLEGQLYYFYHRDRGGDVGGDLPRRIAELVDRAHAAGLDDVDLHAMNVMVVAGPAGEPWPKLFDFNLIPFHVRAPNPFVGWLLRLGLMSPRARDRRKLRRFHDFERVERKLLRFYE